MCYNISSSIGIVAAILFDVTVVTSTGIITVTIPASILYKSIVL